MTSPPPYVTSGEWTKVVLKGGRPNAKIVDLSVAPARPEVPDSADESNKIEQDPRRNELIAAKVLRAHLYNQAHHALVGGTASLRESRCQLKQSKPKALSYDGKGTCELQVLLEGVGGPFELCAKDDAKGEVYSLAFGLCARRLTVSSTIADWEQQLEGAKGSEWPKSWLKDMGKKDKTINFTISIEPGLDASLKSVPLKARLMYSDGLVVPDQKLLMIKNSSIELTDKRPTCTIHFRVEDVSKNHQSKAFLVLVEPQATSAGGSSSANAELASIAPTCAYPVIVKSKINKKRRGGADGEDDEDAPARARTPKRTKAAEAVQPPPELLTVLTVSLSESLIKNSKERAEAEARLASLFEQMRKVQDETNEALNHLTELSRERGELEIKFSDLIAKCSFVDKRLAAPAQLQPGAATTSTSSTGPIHSFSETAGNTFSSAGGLGRSFSAIARGIEEKDLVLGPSTASALMIGDDHMGSIAMCLQTSNLVRLSTGELFSLANSMEKPTTANALATGAPSGISRQDAADEHEEDENGEEEDDDEGSGDDDDEASGPPACSYIRTTPVKMVTGEARWLAFSDTYRLVGYFLSDGAFVDSASLRDTKWKDKQEQQVQENHEGLQKLHSGSQMMQEVLDVIRRS